MGGTISRREINGSQEFTTIPTGLYQSCNWDAKTVKRLILNKRLAPFFPGQEESSETDLEECPICFLFYPGGLNRSTCCKKGICTECFLQIKKPNGQAICPFCQRGSYTVIFTGPLAKEEKEKEAWEQQQVIEAKIRMRNDEIEQDKVRERKKRERASLSLSDSEPGSPSLSSPPSSSPPSSGMEILTSQSLPARQILLVDNPISNMSTSYPPQSSSSSSSSTAKNLSKDFKKKEVDLEDLMLQEALRLSLMTPENGSDTETRDEESKSSFDAEELLDSASETNRDELELALALALSLQNVIK